MAIGDYSIGGYWQLSIVINGYYISGYSIGGYWQLTMVINGYYISGYSIGGIGSYQWFLMVIILMAILLVDIGS